MLLINAYAQASRQVGLHMPFVISRATWFKLFRLGVWQPVRQATGAKWLIIFSLLIACILYYLLTVEITSNHLRVLPISLSVLPRSPIPLLGKGTILLYYPHSLAITCCSQAL